MITIYTDSTSAINAFNKKTLKSHTIKQCIEELNKLSKTNKVSVEWVPGHSNYEGNEIADKLAKEGKNKTIENNNTYRIPHSYYIKKVKNYCSQDIIKGLEGAQLNKPSKILLKK